MIWNLLERWRGRAADKAAAASGRAPRAPAPAGAVAARSVPAVPAPLPPDAVPAEAIDHAFTALVFGIDRIVESAPTGAEQAGLDSLDAAARAGDDVALVPRSATVLPKLLRVLRRDDSSAAELVGLLRGEPALLGEVVRVARSARYGGFRPGADLAAMVSLLGQRGMQEVVARAVMAPIYGLAKGRHRAAGPVLWEHAENSATACAALQAQACDRLHAYLAGMVANTGLLVALRLLDLDLPAPATASRRFCARLTERCAGLSERIARQWQLPSEVVLAVAALGTAGGAAADASELAAALRITDRAGKARLLARLGSRAEAAARA